MVGMYTEPHKTAPDSRCFSWKNNSMYLTGIEFQTGVGRVGARWDARDVGRAVALEAIREATGSQRRPDLSWCSEEGAVYREQLQYTVIRLGNDGR